MADESHSDTCVPFAVSKVLAISQKDAGELLLAEHDRQWSAFPFNRAHLGDPKQGYHHNVIEKVLEDRGFKLVRINDAQYLNAVNVCTGYPIFVYGHVNFDFTPFDKPKGLRLDGDCKKANFHGSVDPDPAGTNRRGHGYHVALIDAQRRLHCLKLFDKKSRKHFDIDASGCLPMTRARPSKGRKRKKSSTEPAEMGQCIITAREPMAYFRNIQSMWSIQKKQPTNSTESNDLSKCLEQFDCEWDGLEPPGFIVIEETLPSYHGQKRSDMKVSSPHRKIEHPPRWDHIQRFHMLGLSKEGMYRAKTLRQPHYMVAREKVEVFYGQLANTGRPVVVYWGDKSTDFLAVRSNMSWVTDWTDAFLRTGVRPLSDPAFRTAIIQAFLPVATKDEERNNTYLDIEWHSGRNTGRENSATGLAEPRQAGELATPILAEAMASLSLTFKHLLGNLSVHDERRKRFMATIHLLNVLALLTTRQSLTTFTH